MVIVHENEHGMGSNNSDEIEVVRKHAEKYSAPDLMALGLLNFGNSYTILTEPFLLLKILIHPPSTLAIISKVATIS